MTKKAKQPTSSIGGFDQLDSVGIKVIKKPKRETPTNKVKKPKRPK